MAKISVIVPIYNVEKYLRECLDSIVNQTLKDLEIILINDGSKDNSLEIINEYASKDNRIVVINKPNGGYGSACNAGLDRATGEYIAIVEPDDYIELNMYEDLYNFSQNGSIDIIKSCFYIFYDTKKLKKDWKENWSTRFQLPDGVFNIYEHPEFISYHPSIWSALYRREFLNENNIRFLEVPGSGWTDNPFRMVTYMKAKSIVYTNEAYYHWRNLYLEVSDALKDITIPYKRSLEIHKWLEENNINDKNIYANLYKIELEYIRILMCKIRLNNFSQIKSEILKIMSLIDENIIKEDTKYLLFGEQKRFFALREGIEKHYFSILLKKLFYPLLAVYRDINFYYKIHTQKNIMFWGASLYLQKFLKRYRVKTKNILGIIDKNPARKGEDFCGYKIYSPDDLNKIKPEKLIMTIKNYHEDRYHELEILMKENYPDICLIPNIFI